MSRSRVLVVGGAGFVGSHLARRLVAQGAAVTVLLRPSTDAGRLAGLAGRVTLVRQDLADGAALGRCFAAARPEAVIHLAGRTASRHVQALEDARLATDGIAALLAVIEAAALADVPPRVFVRTGTIAEYGAADYPFVEGQREAPGNGYALAAVAGTQLAQMLAPQLPFRMITARLALVYGTGQASDFLIPALVEGCLARRPMTLNRPRDRRDLLHVDDVVDALLLLTQADMASGTIVNVGSGESVSVAEIAALALAISGADAGLLAVKPQTDPITLLLATGRMQQLTGWQRRIGLPEGLASVIAAGIISPKAALGTAAA